MSKQFGAPLKYSNKIGLAKSFLEIYMLAVPPKNSMVERAKEALAYFIAYGYDKDKEKNLQYCLSSNVKDGYIRVIINKLKENGYIVKDNKTHQKRLSDEMLYCKEQLFDKNVRTFTIGFLKDG